MRRMQPPESKPPAPILAFDVRHRRRGVFSPVGRLERGCPAFAHRTFLLGGPSPWTKRGQPRQALWLIRTESTGTIGVDAERVVHGLSTVVVPSHKSGGG